MQTAKVLVAETLLTNATATYYTCGSATNNVLSTGIKSCCITNATAGAATVTIYLVESGGTATNPIVSAVNVAAGATYLCPELMNQVLTLGATIQAKSNLNSTLAIRASGIETT